MRRASGAALPVVILLIALLCSLALALALELEPDPCEEQRAALAACMTDTECERAWSDLVACEASR